MTLVSIIIPCYNVEKYIAKSLESALNQTYQTIEVICIDNNSSDQTKSILREYQTLYPERLQVHDEKKPGASAARNKGLKFAKGEWVQFLDADDILKKDKISNQIKIINNNKDITLVIGNYKKESVSGEILSIKKVNQNKNVWINLLRTQLGITSSNLWKKEILIHIGGWNENLKSSQEYDLMFRILKENVPIAYDEQLNTVTVQRGDSISQSNQIENWDRYVKLRLEIIEYIKEHNICENLNQINQYLFDLIRIYHPYNKVEALKLYQANIKGKYLPKISSISGMKYMAIYYLLGFELAQKLSKLSKNWY